MKRIFLILFVSFCAMVSEAQAENIKDVIKKFELFTGCAPIGLVVEKLSEENSKRIKLTRERIINSVESRLRASHIFNDESFYYLYVNVNLQGKAFNLSLEFKKLVRDIHFPELYGLAPSWSTGGTGTHGGDANFVVSGVSEYVDKFLVEYFRVNEKACNKTR